MKLSTQKAATVKNNSSQTLLIPLFENEKFSGAGLDKDKSLQVKEAFSEKEFTGKAGEVLMLPRKGKGRCVLLGLGKKEELTRENWGRHFGKVTRFLQEKKFLEFHVLFLEELEEALGQDEALRFSAFVLHQASYQFQEYVTQKDRHRKPLKQVVFHVFGKRNEAKDKQALKEGRVVGEASALARTLGNIPGLDMTPKYFAETAKKLGKENTKLKVRSLGRAQIKREKMGGLEGVASGSSQEPQFIIMEWMNAPKSKGTRVLAGKSITFDSGGLSIKPADKMDEMKFDMLGGSAVLGAMKAIAELNLKVNVVALLPTTENLSGDKAYRPGDILKAKNGKTIEVLNTDAEGRVVLADALSYASKYKPKLVLDLATLTGACMLALGNHYAGVFSRDEEITKAIQEASRKSGDKVWPLPLDNDFVENMKSDIADVRNISKEGGRGGASTAAAFLEQFTDYPWAHLDIAGVGWNDEKPYQNGGATGYGVALLTELAKSWE